jgi:hypothetical protein
MGRPPAWDPEDVAFLLSLKESPPAIAARYGVTTGAIARGLQRADLPELARPFDRFTMRDRRASGRYRRSGQ